MTLMKLTSLLLVVLPLLSAQPGRFGLPACSAPDQEFADRSFFLLCYDSSARLPVWTVYELLPSQLHGSDPRPSHFRHDPSLSGPSARDSDYRHSGFSRGHMVPAADLAWSAAALRASFLLSNAAPQRQSLNSGRWLQLENAVRQIAAHADSVYIFTGPVFDSPNPELIGPGHVTVPTHFYKVVLVVGGQRKIAYAAILPNSDQVWQPLNDFTVTVDEVERRTGLDFFSGLDDSEELRLESIRQPLPSAGPM